MIGFGITQIIFSQIPDFDQLWWLSIVAAVMSFTYSTIGLGLGIAQVAGLEKKKIQTLTLFFILVWRIFIHRLFC